MCVLYVVTEETHTKRERNERSASLCIWGSETKTGTEGSGKQRR